MLDFIFFSFRYRLGNNMFGEGVIASGKGTGV